MAQPFKSVRLGSGFAIRLFDIPGAPTVSRVASGQFGKLSDELVLYYKTVAAEAINDFASDIAHASLRQVPKGPREDDHRGQFEEGSLAASIRYPGNDPESRADIEYMVAWISYDAPYAGAQHEGMATMVHKHPIIPGQEGFFEDLTMDMPVTIEWKAEHYTTPGTKSHFLSDPYKAAIPHMEPFVYARVRAAFAG